MWKLNTPIKLQEAFLMKKISLISLSLVMLLITSGLSGCIGQEKPAEDNNTSTPSYNSSQNGHPGFWSMLFWSGLWHRHVTPNLRAAKSYITPDTATKTDASGLSKRVDAKDPADITNKNSLSQDKGDKPKVKTSTPRVRRIGRR
jgi:hypothetical protein